MDRPISKSCGHRFGHKIQNTTGRAVGRRAARTINPAATTRPNRWSDVVRAALAGQVTNQGQLGAQWQASPHPRLGLTDRDIEELLLADARPFTGGRY